MIHQETKPLHTKPTHERTMGSYVSLLEDDNIQNDRDRRKPLEKGLSVRNQQQQQQDDRLSWHPQKLQAAREIDFDYWKSGLPRDTARESWVCPVKQYYEQ